MADHLLLEGLEGLQQDTNDAWHTFLCLFHRDCSKEGPLKSLDLLHARLSLVTKQITSISHSPPILCDLETTRSNLHHPTDTFSDRPISCPPTQVGMEYGGKTTVAEPFVKSEFPEKSQPRLGDSSVLPKQDFICLGLRWKSGDEKLDLVQKPLQNPANTSPS
ncbi:hypothetical protein OIDMADRAFT_62169 [Oidiodendron maius Zn]|uniref:Uncharacterized protein n=1 Tax=Oidiodendron maius (strain Zn) TaxID=913774 RepID=A0A0C3GMS0_OIDMZ|nr:hypothetical protein OIDMADRAFT_62169 [Oidiodendron maius Zn]